MSAAGAPEMTTAETSEMTAAEAPEMTSTAESTVPKGKSFAH
jgi:hypothetical protein